MSSHFWVFFPLEEKISQITLFTSHLCAVVRLWISLSLHLICLSHCPPPCSCWSAASSPSPSSSKSQRASAWPYGRLGHFGAITVCPMIIGSTDHSLSHGHCIVSPPSYLPFTFCLEPLCMLWTSFLFWSNFPSKWSEYPKHTGLWKGAGDCSTSLNSELAQMRLLTVPWD